MHGAWRFEKVHTIQRRNMDDIGRSLLILNLHWRGFLKGAYVLGRQRSLEPGYVICSDDTLYTYLYPNDDTTYRLFAIYISFFVRFTSMK